MRNIYLVLTILFSALVVIFMLQNLEPVTVTFLTIRITLPRAALILAIYFLGMLTGGFMLSLIRTWIRRARSR